MTFTKTYTEDGQQYKITAEVRFDDDECKNGHKTFAITGEILRKAKTGRWAFDSCGLIHDDIAKHFPNLAPFFKWHLCSTDRPLHYLANTLYHASDKDCWGRRKGEPSAWERRIRFFFDDEFPFPVSFKVSDSFAKFLEENRRDTYTLKVVEVEFAGTGPKLSSHYTLSGFKDTGNTWGFVPFKSLRDAEELLEALQTYNWEIEKVPIAWSEGEEPDIEAARKTAIWPDATLEQLQDEEQLKARLPGLLAEFRTAIESLGFEW